MFIQLRNNFLAIMLSWECLQFPYPNVILSISGADRSKIKVLIQIVII